MLTQWHPLQKKKQYGLVGRFKGIITRYYYGFDNVF